MHTGFLPRLWCAVLSLIVARPVRWWKKLDINASDNYSHLCGSFPAIRQATGRKARGFSLFMKIFRFKAFPFFFAVTSCFYLKHPLKRKETTDAENGLFGLCRFLSLFLSVE
ncbi:hypothetical protein D9D45_24425 [Escherichia coli]|nr:hypothetical protein [Escherichia coli]EEW2303767.1 hypothetical protein [Escherichia coli]EFA3610215.1 hypothetical protein [Escherichia coli]EFN4461858.1 hypothetical protein [Escherichia coli]MGD45094.1 hypothetical protein [Escherichia coli]